MLYVGDGNATFKILTHKDLSTASSFGIRYQKPDATEGEVTDGITLSENKNLNWTVGDNEFFDIPGIWKFQSFAIFGGLYAYGTIFSIHVHQNIVGT